MSYKNYAWTAAINAAVRQENREIEGGHRLINGYRRLDLMDAEELTDLFRLALGALVSFRRQLASVGDGLADASARLAGVSDVQDARDLAARILRALTAKGCIVHHLIKEQEAAETVSVNE